MIIALGIVLILLGIKIVFRPVFYDYIFETYFDLRGYNIPLGIAMIIIGVAFVWTEVKKLKK